MFKRLALAPFEVCPAPVPSVVLLGSMAAWERQVVKEP